MTTAKQEFKLAFRAARLEGFGACFGSGLSYAACRAADRCLALRNYHDPLTATTAADRIEQRQQLRALLGA